MSDTDIDIPPPPPRSEPLAPAPSQALPAPQEDSPTPGGMLAEIFTSGVLRFPAFRRFWFGAAVSNIGNFMESVGVRWLMTIICASAAWKASDHPSGTMMLAYLSSAQLAPMLILGIPGGLVADRVNRRLMLLWTQVMMMVIAGLLAIAAATGHASPTLLLVLSVAQGITMAFNYPAWQVVIPKLVPRAELGRAIALNSLAFNLARVVGPMAAGLLLALFSGVESPDASPDKINLDLVLRGAAVLFTVNTLSFLGVIFAVTKSPITPVPDRAASNGSWHMTAWEETRTAVSFVFTQRGPRALFIGVVLFSVLGGSVLQMLPEFAVSVYHQKEAAYGTLLSLMGVGACLGATTLHRVPHWYPRHHLIPLAMSAAAIGMIVFSCSTSMLIGAAIMPLIGFFWVWTFSSSIAAMQLLVDDVMRGRVMAVSNTAIFGGAAVGALLTGVISETFIRLAGGTVPAEQLNGLGLQLGLGIPAALLFAAAMVMLIWRTPEVDGIRPGEPGYDRRPGLMRGITASAHRPDVAPRRHVKSPDESTDEPLGI